MTYIIRLKSMNSNVIVNVDDFELDNETQSIVFYKKNEDVGEDVSTAYFPLSEVLYVTE